MMFARFLAALGALFLYAAPGAAQTNYGSPEIGIVRDLPGPACRNLVVRDRSTAQVPWGCVNDLTHIFSFIGNGSALTGLTANQIGGGTFGGTYIFAGPSTTIIPQAGWSGSNTAQLNLGDANNLVGATFGGRAFLTGFNGVELRYGSGPSAGLILDAAGLVTVGALATNSGGVNLQPTPFTLTPAVTTLQALAGTTAVGPVNSFTIASDTVDAGAGSGAGLTPWFFNHFFGGNTVRGGRTGVGIYSTMTAATSATNANRQYDAASIVFNANATDGGTGTTQAASKGAVGALNPIVIASSAAVNMNVVGAVEINTSMQAGSSAWYKFGLAVANGYSDAVRGSVYDAGYVLGRVDATVTWKYGFGFFDAHGNQPLGSDSIAIGSIGTSVIGSFFDFPNYSCSGGNIIRINTVYAVDCNGALTAGNISVAHIAATGTPSSTTFLSGAGTWATPPGIGTVTSVGLSVTGPLYTVTGSPVTGAGTLTATINTQAANLVFAGPSSGAAAAPTFRSLVAADMPAFAGGDATSSAGSVALTLGANVVSYAKFQQVAASSIVGNPTGSLANAQGITLGATFAFSGTALQTAAHTGDMTTPANSFVTTVVKVNGVAYGTSPSTNTVPVVTGVNAVTYEAVPNAALANSTISGVALGGNLFALTFGTHITGTSYNGSAGVTIATDATNANTLSTIVARDGSGNFSAGTISAALTGHASLDCALTGCTMSGAIAMGGNNITGAGTVAATNHTGTFAGNTWTTGTGTLTIAAGKTWTVNNTLTISGTDASTLNVGTGGTLGTAAFVNTGTSGGTVPLLNGTNTFSADQRVNGNIFVNSATEKVWNTGGSIVVESGSNAVFLRASGVIGLSVNSTTVTIASGVVLQLGNAYVAGLPTNTGTVRVTDSAGVIMRVPGCRVGTDSGC
jgi:hypothetical protein